MHPRQATLLNQASVLTEKLSAKTPGTSLWEYTDPEGNVFYLKEKKTTVKSPFNGKSFTAKPKKFSLAQVGEAMREEKQEAAKKPKTKEAGMEPGLWAAIGEVSDIRN